MISIPIFILTLSLPESIMESSNVVLTFESLNEVLWCDYSNESSSAVLSLGTVCFSIICKRKFGIFLDFRFWTLLGVKGVRTGQTRSKSDDKSENFDARELTGKSARESIRARKRWRRRVRVNESAFALLDKCKRQLEFVYKQIKTLSGCTKVGEST